MEAVIGVRSLSEIQADMSAIMEEWARGAALYGERGLMDNLRKALLSERAVAQREVLVANNAKVTDSIVSDAAHADGMYVEWLDTQEMRFRDWLILDARKRRLEAEERYAIALAGRLAE